MDNNKRRTGEEIDLLELALKLWQHRKTILKFVIVFIVIGLVISFGSKKEYKSEVVFILDDSHGGSRVSGLLAQFGGLAGIDVSGNDGEGMISPDLFPNVISSSTFLLQILDSNIFVSEQKDHINLYEYFLDVDKPSFLGYLKKYTLGLPGVIFKGKSKGPESIEKIELFENRILDLSKRQEEIMTNLSERINIHFDETTGAFKLSAIFPDSKGAAELTNITYKALTKYLIEYKIDKAEIDYEFVLERYLEAENQYKSAQARMANFRDKNKNIISSTIKTREENLVNEYQLRFNIYNGLAQQLEQSKIKTQEAIPVLRVINPIKVNQDKIKPRRALIMIFSSILGGILGVIAVLAKLLLEKVNFKTTD